MSVPVEIFNRVTQTRIPEYWTDERGFSYEVAWSLRAGKALAHCVSKPEGVSKEDAWETPRTTNPPSKAESLSDIQQEWNRVGRMMPGGFMDGDDEGGPTEWVLDGSLTAHPEDWEYASDPPTLFEGAGHDEGVLMAASVAKLWNRIPELLRICQESEAEIKRLKRSL